MKDIGQGSSLIDFTDYNYIYIDKTEQIYSLLRSRRVFFSRPRRFGKSLVLDTIATLFEHGVEPYFKDTWIYDKWEEKTYPVLRLNFLEFSVTSYKDFCIDFAEVIADFAETNNIDYEPSKDPIEALDNLFESLDIIKQKIVILIDEYDCQMTANINNPELYKTFLEAVRTVYRYIKGKAQIRFMAITGVTRLQNTAIFSVGSDVLDMSNEHSIATIVGFTSDEIRKFYKDYLILAASYTNNCKTDEVTDDQREAVLEKLAEEYDGYCFDKLYKDKVFCTWSVNRFFHNLILSKKIKYEDYWYDNGGIPSILANYLKNQEIAIKHIKSETIEVKKDLFQNVISLLDIEPSVLMYQTGYLTLRSSLNSGNNVKLGLPNQEIKRAISRLLSAKIFPETLNRSVFEELFTSGNIENIVSKIQSHLNGLSYERYPITDESVFKGYLYMLFSASDLDVSQEVQNSKGRSDLEIEMPNLRVILELKYGESEKECTNKLEEAKNQILNRDYGNKYPKKDLLRLALVFNGAKKVRAITHYDKV